MSPAGAPHGRVTVKLDHRLVIYTDAHPDEPTNKQVRIETRTVSADSILHMQLSANGGEAVRIVPVRPTP